MKKNILNYIKEYGNITFEDSKFNNIDNLVLSVIAYVNFDGIISNINRKVTLEETKNKFFSIYDEKEILKKKSLVNEYIHVLKAAGESVRYKDIRLSNYVNNIDYETEEQFSAIKYTLPDKSIYIGFRGTDDTILGWKEDFNMSFIYPVPSQISALKYLNEHIHFFNKKVRLGGHSKGGNLAVYAGCKCNKLIRKKIIQIFSNDGPGFVKEFIESEEFQKNQNKITKIVPQGSIIGMLLEHSENYKVVKSNSFGILQHDAMSWVVENGDFIYLGGVDNNSKFFDVSISTWVEKLSKEQREKFIDGLFGLLETANITTTEDILKIKASTIKEFIKATTSLDKETSALIKNTIFLLVTEMRMVHKNKKSKV